jgi:hypothetical protein
LSQGLLDAGGAGGGGLAVGGALAAGAALAGGRAAKGGATGRAQTPEFRGKALLALTHADVALVTLKVGWTGKEAWTGKAGEVIARMPRDEVTEARFAGGIVPKLSISFADGSAWSMDVPRVFKKQRDTRRIVELLNS